MKNLFIRLWEFIVLPTHSRTLSILSFLAILLAIPLTVFIAQQQQEIRQRASEGTGCPDQCYSTELWVGIPKLADGTCDNLHPQSVFKCPGEENKVTCGGQPYYCDGYWKPGVRPQAPTATPIPTSTPPSVGGPTATPTPTRAVGGGNGARTICGVSCLSVTGDSLNNCTGNTFLSVTDLGSGRCLTSCTSCGDKVGNPQDRCNCANRPTATPRPTQPAGGGPGGGGPTATPTSAPPGAGPTATPTPTGTRIAGDIDGSGSVDTIDYSILISCFGANANLPSCQGNKAKADLNNDGNVGGIDYNILIRNFGR